MKEPISVTYTFVDGAHFFTTDDPDWAGLCSASTVLKDAWDDVSVQLNVLAIANHGVKISKFQPVETYEEFLHKMIESLETEIARRDSLTREHKPVPTKRAISSKRVIWKPLAMAA